MAQLYTQTGDIGATFANNLAATSGSGETIILDGIPCLGLKNIGVTITSVSGSISACALYGSADNTNWVVISGLASFALTIGQTKHSEAVAVWQFLRLTTTGAATINAYLDAVV